MGLEIILDYADHISLLVWIVAMIAVFKFRTNFKSQKGWNFVFAGTVLVVLRDIVPFVSDYVPKIVKYSVGGVAAIVLLIGFYMLYKEVTQ